MDNAGKTINPPVMRTAWLD